MSYLDVPVCVELVFISPYVPLLKERACAKKTSSARLFAMVDRRREPWRVFHMIHASCLGAGKLSGLS